MNLKSKINKVIKAIQSEQDITRTAALYYLTSKYGVSYDTVFNAAKHGRMPKRKASADKILEIIGN